MRALRARRGRDEAVDCGRRKFAMTRKGSTTISPLRCPNLTALDRFGRTGKSRMAVSANHEIVRVPPGREEELRQQCYNVRIKVFHHEQGFPLEAEIDELRLIWPPTADAAAPYCCAYFRAFPD